MNPANLIIILILIVWIAYALFGLVKKIRGEGSCCGGGMKIAKKVKVKDKKVSNYPYCYRLKIEGMVCSGCVRNVENTLNSVDGLWAKVNLERKETDVLSKTIMTRDDFVKLFSKTSYTVTNVTNLKKI